jgi:hypothetical protein
VSVGLDRLHAAMESIPVEVRGVFKATVAENRALRARVARLEKELAHERQLVRQVAGVKPRVKPRRPALTR